MKGGQGFSVREVGQALCYAALLEGGEAEGSPMQGALQGAQERWLVPSLSLSLTATSASARPLAALI